MARPWKKAWPYVGQGGRKSYRVGFRDHEGRERTKAFPSAKHGNEWMDEYVSAERRGLESLRRFLLDLDAKEANVVTSTRTIGDVIELYFAFNAPDTKDGLARSTFKTYRHSASRHLLGLPGSSRGKPLKPAAYAVRFASQDAARFNDPAAPRALREALRPAQVGTSARAHAWRVLSAVLSWAAGSELVPEIEVNGCLLANEKIGNRRKSMRSGSGQATLRRRGEAVRSWALSPTSVELVRAEMLSRVGHTRRLIVAHRDSMIVSLQFGLALRNQEVYGFRWANLVTGNRAQERHTKSAPPKAQAAKHPSNYQPPKPPALPSPAPVPGRSLYGSQTQPETPAQITSRSRRFIPKLQAQPAQHPPALKSLWCRQNSHHRPRIRLPAPRLAPSTSPHELGAPF